MFGEIIPQEKLDQLKFPLEIYNWRGPRGYISLLHNTYKIAGNKTPIANHMIPVIRNEVHAASRQLLDILTRARRKSGVAFMCQSGMSRSYFLSEIAVAKDIHVIENPAKGIYGGDKFGIHTIRDNIRNGTIQKEEIFQVKNNQVYFCRAKNPIGMLVIAFDPFGRGEEDLKLLIELLAEVPSGLSFEVVFFVTSETMVELVVGELGFPCEEFDPLGKTLHKRIRDFDEQ